MIACTTATINIVCSLYLLETAKSTATHHEATPTKLLASPMRGMFTAVKFCSHNLFGGDEVWHLHFFVI